MKKNQIWSLGNFSPGIQVNPHYFGEMQLKKKNRITKFFITSTIRRKYQLLISAVEKLKKEKFKFHIIVVGKRKTFSKKNICKNLRNNFTFKYNITYSELYTEVYDSDYIIINLDPDNEYDSKFMKIRVTGSVQLAYGFLKPVLIHKNFANFYKFNFSNSFIYENSTFDRVMKDAIKKKKKKYNKMQENLLLLSKEIYRNSFYNVKSSLNEL